MEYAACAWRAGRGVCRCCLSEGCYKDIATEYYWMGERELYQDMLRECFDLTISYQDGGTNSNSRLICEVCITRLRDASNFKKQVINAEKRFAEHILTGSKLSDITEAAPAATFQEVKLEGVKDETGISDDDDMGADEAATDDPDYDPDYDESDMLPLKFEVQKKEALVEFSFGDEMPTLNTNETTIRRVSKSKGKSPSKKIKMSKKELTIKPIKASGSKVAKVPKAPKPAKVPVKKGRDKKIRVKSFGRIKQEPFSQESEDTETRYLVKRNAALLLENTNICPFRWWQNRYRCSYCSDTFVDMPSLRMHRDESHPTPSARGIYRNMKSFGTIRVDVSDAKCTNCHTTLDGLNEAMSHLSSEHGFKLFESKSSGLIPFKLCTEDVNLKCQQCEAEFVTFSKLKEHTNTHYETCICESCGKAFSSVTQLKTHVQLHKQGKFPCPKCEQVFNTIGAREHHKNKVHFKSPRHKCPYCLEKFMHYYERSKHMKEVHDAKVEEYKCSMCPLVFATSSKRSMHLRTVHLPRQRTHSCTLCSWSFVNRCDLKQHMVRHNGERIYQCEVCKKSYARRWTLKEHMRIHNNDRRFVCSVCSSAFVQKCTLKQHIRVHHPGEPLPT